MILKKMIVHRGYGDSDAPLRGEIEFKTDGGNELKMKLDEKLSQDIVKLCAEAVLRAGQEAATWLAGCEAKSQTLIEHDAVE